MNDGRAFARRGLTAVLLLGAIVATPVRAQDSTAAGLTGIPAAVGYVNDHADVIPESRRAELEAFLDQLHTKTGAQFAILTVTTCAPEEPSAYKTRVFKQWGIGNAERDDGLLMLAAEYRFEVVPKVELALLYDAGKVFPELGELDLQDLRRSYGVGIRLKSPRKVKLRLDVWRSPEGTRVRLKFGPSF